MNNEDRYLQEARELLDAKKEAYTKFIRIDNAHREFVTGEEVLENSVSAVAAWLRKRDEGRDAQTRLATVNEVESHFMLRYFAGYPIYPADIQRELTTLRTEAENA